MYQKIIDYHNKLASKICIPVNFNTTLPALAKKFRVPEETILVILTEEGTEKYKESDWETIYIYWGDGSDRRAMGRINIINSTTILLGRFGNGKDELHTFAKFKYFVTMGTLTDKKD